MSDLGYATAHVRGRFSGTDFRTFPQVKPGLETGLFQLNVYAYQDDTFVTSNQVLT